MPVSTGNQITAPLSQRFFLSPAFPLQRQYEALRAFFVDEEPSADVAKRFAYSPGAFRVLCHQFRHDPEKRASFFRQPNAAPNPHPLATASGSWPWPLARKTFRSMTSSVNSPRPTTPSASTP